MNQLTLNLIVGLFVIIGVFAYWGRIAGWYKEGGLIYEWWKKRNSANSEDIETEINEEEK